MDLIHLAAFVIGILIISKADDGFIMVGVVLNFWAWGLI